MAESNLQFNQLSDSAKRVAVSQFSKFYVRYFRNEGLDVFTQLDRTGYITDINQYLMENSALHSDELIVGLIANRGENMGHLLDAIGVTFAEDGTPQPTLEQWYMNEKSQVIR